MKCGCNEQEKTKEEKPHAACQAAYKSVPKLIADNNYINETHTVTTLDGYILEMHRVKGPVPAVVEPETENRPFKPVVFLMHGLLSSSADWVITGPGKGLAYVLADAGYDVWMGNARGNTYSKKHETKTDLTSKDFWKFSWHEIGVHDLPAMIDFALNSTGQKKLIYIGHSQGTTSFFVMASERPDYNDKIKAMFALAPVAYMGKLCSPLLKLGTVASTPISFLLKLFGVHEFLPTTDALKSAACNAFEDDDLSQQLRTNALFVLCGFNKAQLNTSLLPVMFAHTPAGASTRQLLHYSQGICSKQFRQYDHGCIKNKLKYGSVHPPKYNLSKITSPVHLYYSDNDWMAAVEDVKQLHSELGNSVELRRVLDGKWNHLDFLWGIDAKRLVYDDILATLKKCYSEDESLHCMPT